MQTINQIWSSSLYNQNTTKWSFKECLEHTKATLQNLEVSSALFVELDRMPESQLSIREYVLVQVHRLIKKERDEAERSRRETESLRTTVAYWKIGNIWPLLVWSHCILKIFNDIHKQDEIFIKAKI